MMERMKKAFEKTYILTFTNLESVYAEEEKLDAPKPSSGNGVSVNFSGGNNSKYYKITYAVNPVGINWEVLIKETDNKSQTI